MSVISKMGDEEFLAYKESLKGADKRKAQSEREVLQIINEEGYSLISEYNGVKEHIDLLCNNGHDYSVVAGAFKKGARCTSCTGRKPSVAKKRFFDKVKQLGYTVGSEFKNMGTYVELTCDKGHTYRNSPSKIMRGVYCSRCSGKHPSIRESLFLEKIENLRFTLKTPYVNYKGVVNIECEKGHETIVSASRWNGLCKVCEPPLKGRYSWDNINKDGNLANTSVKLYLITFKSNKTGECFWKVGLDSVASFNSTRHGRRSGDYEISLHYKGLFKVPDAFCYEQTILQYMRSIEMDYCPEVKLKGKGTSECFLLKGVSLSEHNFEAIFTEEKQKYKGYFIKYTKDVFGVIERCSKKGI